MYDGANAQRFDRIAIEQKVRQHIDGWRALLTKRTSEGRQLLREVLAGPLRFTPGGDERIALRVSSRPGGYSQGLPVLQLLW